MTAPRPILSQILALTLAAILALTSQGLALARGQGMAAGYVVICMGNGLAAMPVDAGGRPLGPAHICPDGVLGVAGAAPPPAVAAPALRLAAIVAPAPALPEAAPAFRPVPAARGPPAAA